MELTTSLRVSTHNGLVLEHEEGVGRLAEKARKDKRTDNWLAYQSIAGEAGRYLYVSPAASWAEFTAREPVPEAVVRLFGEDEGRALLEQIGRSMASQEMVVLTQREELSHVEPPAKQPVPQFMRTLIRVSPGGQETVEELIRRVSEAIPKVEDERRFSTLQTIMGDLMQYSIVQPIQNPELLDRQRLVPDQLL